MTALYNREKTGKGDVIRCSLLAAGLWHNICGLLRYQAGHNFPKEYNDAVLPLDNYFLTKDGKWLLTSEENWEQRCPGYFKLFGTPEKQNDPEWSTLRGYITNIPEKCDYFAEQFAKVTSEEITECLTEVGAVFSFLDETDDVLTNEQAWANDFLRDMTTMDGTKLTITNLPINFKSQTYTDEITPAPQLGQDSKKVLSEIGYSEADIAALVEKKAVVAYKG